MRDALAIARIYARSMLTYRTRTLLSLLSTVVAIVPVYFVGVALRDFAQPAVAGQALDYFGYVVVGAIGTFVVAEAAGSIPSITGSYIASGMLEQLLATPARWPSVLTGVSLYGYAWVAARALLVLGSAWILGETVHWARVPEAALVFALIALAIVPLGLVAGACVVVVRSSLFVPQVAVMATTLFGAVYFPVSALPPAVRPIGELLPFADALTAARRLLLLDVPFTAVVPLLAPITLWAAGGLCVGGLAFALALRQARRHGTLAQY